MYASYTWCYYPERQRGCGFHAALPEQTSELGDRRVD
jgi:hypothetical protein